MDYKKINNITGWVVCAIACIVYLMTKEASASFWDCGEFLSGAYKLEVVHSPGAPLFLMVGRLFTLFASPATAASWLNSMSALLSGFTILFLFWSITHFAKRIITKRNEEINQNNLFAIMGAGIVGALAYTFSDTFWFSAVEGEVYAFSSFLTAVVFWAILKWEDVLTQGDKRADKWIVFIAFVIGLSTGVHLLSLLAIPAIVILYYFNKYKFSWTSFLIALVVGFVITEVVQVGIIQGLPAIAAKFDLFFVNSLNMPFNSGALFFILLLFATLYFAIRWAQKHSKYNLYLGLLSAFFIILGFTSYIQVLIRSNADVPIDMTNPDNMYSLVKYLARDQYGKQPILFGPDYNVMEKMQESGDRAEGKYGREEYIKWNGKYEEAGRSLEGYNFPSQYTRFFPRIWDFNDPNHVRYYKSYLGIGEDDPTTADNFKFFMRYQVNKMWWRYFMWNYAGRQNDYQQLFDDPDNGNWLSGIKFIDKMRGLGDVDKLTEDKKNSKARNELYLLPFILGIIGLLYHYKNHKNDTLIIFLLFFFTGIATVVFLNNTPLQPRERDYAFAGATYAFAIWIGLGVMQINDWLKKYLSGVTSPAIATTLCLIAVPALMCAKEWDDHDRSQKTLPPAVAKNYLDGVEPNGILFTEGDNDTYPLWYLQEMEGYRKDVRIINLSLLGIDWYISQLNYKTNDAPKVDMLWKPEAYKAGNRDYIQFYDAKIIPQDVPQDLTSVLNFVNSDDANAKLQTQGGEAVNFLPTTNVFINTGSKDSTGGKMVFNIGNKTLYKNDLAILNIVAANFGKRPIYFSNTVDSKHYEGLYEYIEKRGMVGKLTSTRHPNVAPNTIVNEAPYNTDATYDIVMNKFKFGGMEKNGKVYFDEKNRLMMNFMRSTGANLAAQLAKEGKKDKAIQVLDHFMKNMPFSSYPLTLNQYDITGVLMAYAYIQAGASDKAKAILDKCFKYINDDLNYTKELSEAGRESKADDIAQAFRVMNLIRQACQETNNTSLMNEINTKLGDIINKNQSVLPQEVKQMFAPQPQMPPGQTTPQQP